LQAETLRGIVVGTNQGAIFVREPFELYRDLELAMSSIPLLDPHTHLDAAHLSARGLDDILLYHMAVSDLFSAGCPNGTRISEDRTETEARERILEALPYLPKVRNTAISWGVRIILQDLYDWHEPITEQNWEGLDERICERAADPSWPREILKRAGIVRTGTELWRGRNGSADDILQYSLEWAFFARTQWGQPDIPLYELERAWNETTPGVPIPVTFDRASAPPLERTIRAVDDVDEAVAHYCDLIPYGEVMATAQHLSTDIDYTEPDTTAMQAALRNRASARGTERDVYASYILRRFLGELAKRGERTVFQFSLGAEPLPHESAARLSQHTIKQLAELIARYPEVQFMCFLASRHGNQSLCTLARELPNLSLAGYWWHNFFPGAIRQVMEERLDMLPLNKQIGFFSDAYCAEWSYAKAVIVRKLLAEVLANKIALGQYTRDDALGIAKAILHDSSLELLGMEVK
jgi:glucuronate isomerase